MTPLRLYLKGFLSFRDEATLEFEPDQIISLNGPNGAGKSTVFDAMLFALFGGHRAGREPTLDLLHKECDEAVVQFDFRLADATYRAQRSLRKKAPRKGGKLGTESTRQLYEQDGDGRFRPIPQTHRDDGFKEWIGEHVGLTYDAFISSVLLMEGRADALTKQEYDAAQSRFQVLSRIVGLEFYQRMHKVVSAREKTHESQRDRLSGELQGFELVNQDRLDRLDADISAAKSLVKQQRAALEAVEQRLQRSEHWRRLRTELTQEQDKLADAEQLIGERETIEADGKRWQELNLVLPDLRTITELRASHAGQVQSLRDLEKELAQTIAEEKVLAEDAQHLSATSTNLAQQIEDARRLWNELNLNYTELNGTVAVLKRLRDERSGLAENQRQLAGATDLLAKAQLEAAAATTQVAEREQRHRDADHAFQNAAARFTRAETELEAIRKRADRFAAVRGERVCSQCGQELTAEHAVQEQARIDRELEARLAEYDAALAERAALEQQLAAARAAQSAAQKVERTARDQVQKRRSDVEAFSRGVADATGRVTQAYRDLPAEWQQRVASSAPADWTTTTFPTDADLTETSSQLAKLAIEKDQIQEHGRAVRREFDALGPKLDRLKADHQKAKDNLVRLDKQKSLTEQRSQSLLDQAGQALERLPAEWRVAADSMSSHELGSWRQEFDRLTEANAKGRWEALQGAASNCDAMRRNVEELQRQLNEVAPDDRVDPQSVRSERDAAQAELLAASNRQATLEHERRRLVDVRQKYAEAERKLREAERQRRLHERLAELLGEKRLQRALLKRAEVGIVENANRVLDRLTAGQMILRLVDDEENKRNQALKLEVIKPGDQKTYNLAHLSGSERFRVAVSLALGIGQYASRLHRPIDSVMIDEGFGCLDPGNRRTMIEEIGLLRGQLQCIILVSHQEDFAEAYPNGYRFRKENGTTVVEPLAS